MAGLQIEQQQQQHHPSFISLFCLYASDLQSLFPGHDIQSGPFTVISISQRTANDMSGWNAAVDDEREDMLETVRAGEGNVALYAAPNPFLCTFYMNIK